MCLIKPKYESVRADVKNQNVFQILQKLESILSVRNSLFDLVCFKSHILKAIFVLQNLVSKQRTYRVEQKFLATENPLELPDSLKSSISLM